MSRKMKGVRYTPYEHHSLKKAVCQGRIEKVREIISSRSLYYLKEWSDAYDGYALLCTAVKKKHTEIVKLLLTNGSKVNSENENSSEIPLYLAVRNGDIEIVEMLLHKGANIDATTSFGYTPLHMAVVLMKMQLIGTNGQNGAPMHHAARSGSEEIIKLLLNKGANVNAQAEDGTTSLHLALRYECDQIAELFLKYGANVNALYNSRSEEDYTPLHLAVRYGSKAIIKVLLSNGANINAEAKHGITPLHIALMYRHGQIAEHLLKYGANVNAVYNIYGGEKGYTPLHLAARHGSEEIIKFLLSKGANVNAQAEDGTTSLHIALRYECYQIAELLLKYGANVNAVYSFENEEGYTSLHLAAENDLGIIELLLKFGATINSIDEYGQTALHIASKNGHEEIVMVLLEHGSDTTIMSKQNYTALDFAMYPHKAVRDDDVYSNYGHKNVVKILKHHMVKIKVANLYAVNNDKLSISSVTFCNDDEELSDFQNECEKEIAGMKSEVFNDNITFYDILTGSVRQVAMYATNESVVEALESDNYKIKFPIYASMINRNFRKGEKEKEFLEKGDKIFGFLFSKNFPWLPRDCTDKILSYLNYEDLI